MNKNTFLALENGRFEKILKACDGFNDYCFKCRYFKKDEPDSYRCHGTPHCPAATLNPNMIDYLFRHTTATMTEKMPSIDSTRGSI